MVKEIAATLLMISVSVSAYPITDTMTGTFSDRIRTLQAHPDMDPLGEPIWIMNEQTPLIISFDDLSEDYRYLRYSLVHCDRRWQPSGLVDTEFLNGFNEKSIDDYRYSRGTATHYVHYTIAFPSPDMQPLLSGNYLLRIYDESDPDEILAQVRLMVVEPKTGISADVTGVTDVDYNSAHQQLTIMVDTEGSEVRDPFNDLTVMISQNGRLDNEVTVTKPMRVVGKTFVYEHLPSLIFDGGNEYRRMEAVSVTYPGMHVDAIEYRHPYYHVFLTEDKPRLTGRYEYDETQNGAFYIRDYNSDDSDIEAEYVIAHFSLDMPKLATTDIYLDGDLTMRRFDDSSRMVYNPDTQRYEKVMLLKLGAYNYQYLTVGPHDTRGRTDGVEGNHYQTGNRYLIKVYERKPGERYDRLIGVNRIVVK